MAQRDTRYKDLEISAAIWPDVSSHSLMLQVSVAVNDCNYCNQMNNNIEQ